MKSIFIFKVLYFGKLLSKLLGKYLSGVLGLVEKSLI